jgi:hypothetical protein
MAFFDPERRSGEIVRRQKARAQDDVEKRKKHRDAGGVTVLLFAIRLDR